MSGTWLPLGQVYPTELVEARLQCHFGADWLARAARAYIPPKDDDSHTSLLWFDAREAVVGHVIDSEFEPFRLGFCLADPTLFVFDPDQRERASLPLDDLTQADVRQWLGAEMGACGLDADKLDTPSPYNLPAHGIAGGGMFDTKGNSDPYEELSRYFANVEPVLQDVTVREAGASPVRCWPHHFDLATLIGLDEGSGEEARSIGVGLSPGDEGYAQPYLYVTPWPYPEKENLPELIGPGIWHTEGWVGAVLLAEELVGGDTAEAQQTMLRGFVDNAITACRAMLES